MWIGELITERGIGNGISFIIFAGIVSRAPGAVQAFIISPNIATFVAFAVLAVAAVGVIIYIQEGQRRIPIQYASRVRGRRMYSGGQTFLPLRVNQAGVIPIIFAVEHPAVPAAARLVLHDLGDHDRGRHRHRGRDLLQPELDRVLDPAVHPDDGLHVLLHGVHVQARRDGRAAAQERRLHPGHPAGPAHPGLPRPRRDAHHVRRRPVPGHRRDVAVTVLDPRARTSARSPSAAPAS